MISIIVQLCVSNMDSLTHSRINEIKHITHYIYEIKPKTS